VRAFTALDLQDDLRRRLGELRESLRGSFPLLRWVRPEGIHLTLRFLGQVPSEQIAGLPVLLEPAARASGPIDATIAGLGLFPDRGSPRVLWLGISADASLSRIQAACEAAAVTAGFPPEPRPFRAHLTLGRWRDRVPRPALPPADLGATRFSTVTLFKSELRPSGSVYTALGRCLLGHPRAG
jgi:2'-5' RNA ligase